MKNLNVRAFSGLLFLIIVIATTLFLPAWTINYWQAWVFLIVFLVTVSVITLYLMKKDPKLLERRVKAGPVAEKQISQKIIQFLASLAFIAIFVLSALDYRFKWSSVPIYVIVVGDILVFLGLIIVFFVFRENTFTSAIIEVDNKQKVISTGPYKQLRHPMYTGAIIMLLGVPLSLGSWWGILTVIPLVLVIISRLLDEEKFLTKNLPGYSDYKKEVRYRLIPFIW
jgi:protein-S-isoprenylcysteine O-methyltransferase Ste14